MQVTNPPIDPLREGLVMSLAMRLGARGNLLQPGPDAYQQIMLDSPVLLETELRALQNDQSLVKMQVPSFLLCLLLHGAMSAAMSCCRWQSCPGWSTSLPVAHSCMIANKLQGTSSPARPIPCNVQACHSLRRDPQASMVITSVSAVQTISTFFTKGEEGGLQAALQRVCDSAEAAAGDGIGCLVLSDRCDSMDEAAVPIPMLLAVGAVHHRLVRAGLRSDTSIVAEAAQCVSTHHVAVLVGYGAHAVCPYLALEAVRQWRSSKRTVNMISKGRLPDVSIRAAQRNYKKALEKGVLKILSKMGISLLSCYHGAQIFEAYGLGQEVIDTAFRGSVSRIGGMTFADIQVRAAAFVCFCCGPVCATQAAF